MSGTLPVKPVLVRPDEEYRPKQMKCPTIIEQAKQEAAKSKEDDFAVPGPSRPTAPEPSTSEAAIPKPVAEPPKKTHVEFTKEDLDRLEGETKRLDDRNTILYSLESVVSSASDDDIPDSFFDVTLSDMRKLFSQMKENVRSMDNAPLMTSKLRDLEDSKKTLIQLQYRETLIRIQFPNRLVMQTVFKPIDTVAQVKDFLRPFLDESSTPFDLCEYGFKIVSISRDTQCNH